MGPWRRVDWSRFGTGWRLEGDCRFEGGPRPALVRARFSGTDRLEVVDGRRADDFDRLAGDGNSIRPSKASPGDPVDTVSSSVDPFGPAVREELSVRIAERRRVGAALPGEPPDVACPIRLVRPLVHVDAIAGPAGRRGM